MGYFSKFNKINYDLEGDGIYTKLINISSSVVLSKYFMDNTSIYTLISVNEGERIEQLSHRLYGTPEYYWTFILMNPSISNIWHDWPKSSTQLQEWCEAKHPDIVLIPTIATPLIDSELQIGDKVEALSDPGIYSNIVEMNVNNNYIVLKGDIDIIGSGSIQLVGNDLVNSSGEFKKGCYAPHHHLNADGDVVSYTSSITPISFLQYEEWRNDNNRTIRVIRPDIIKQVVRQFELEISK